MRKLPPLAELRAFEAAARHLSFKAAGEELAVTATAISHQIKLLEAFCGILLFRRRPRPLALTEAGARFSPWYATVSMGSQLLSRISRQALRKVLLLFRRPVLLRAVG